MQDGKKSGLFSNYPFFRGEQLLLVVGSVGVFRGELAVSFPGSAKSYHVEFLVQQKLNMVLDLFIFGDFV